MVVDDQVINCLKNISIEAGLAILEIYKRGCSDINIKKDNSPLTEADLSSHRVIIDGLSKLKIGLPILSEESELIDYEKRKLWDKYWLIDPLDGTKEFIKRNGDFTVNIALIQNGYPSFGMVYIPVSDTLYYGSINMDSAVKIEGASKAKPIQTKLKPIRNNNHIRIVASKSHLNKKTEEVINIMTRNFNKSDIKSYGSSLKLCKIADGSADLYPRYAPTMEWDTAAADAICRSVGCYVLSAETHEPLKYNKEDLLNPHFYVTSCNKIKMLMETI